MSVNCEEIIVYSILARAIRARMTIFIVKLRFLIALGVVLLSIAVSSAFLVLIEFFKTSVSGCFSSSYFLRFLSSSSSLDFLASSS
jgi:hypothetical protein